MIGAKELIRRLPVVDENILAEAARNPVFFMDAARYRVSKMRMRLAAEAALEYTSSRISLRLRRRGEKSTEGAIKAALAIDSRIVPLRQALHSAEASEELAKLILEAIRYRRDAIRIIGEARVYEGVRESSEVERITAKRKLQQTARELNERRQRTGE